VSPSRWGFFCEGCDVNPSRTAHAIVETRDAFPRLRTFGFSHPLGYGIIKGSKTARRTDSVHAAAPPQADKYKLRARGDARHQNPTGGIAPIRHLEKPAS